MADAQAPNPVVCFSGALALVGGMLCLLEASLGGPAFSELKQVAERPLAVAVFVRDVRVLPQVAANPAPRASLQRNLMAPGGRHRVPASPLIAEGAVPEESAAAYEIAVALLDQADMAESLPSPAPDDNPAAPPTTVLAASPPEIASVPHVAASSQSSDETSPPALPTVSEPESAAVTDAPPVPNQSQAVPKVALAQPPTVIGSEPGGDAVAKVTPSGAPASSSPPMEIVLAEETVGIPPALVAPPPLPRRKPYKPAAIAAADNNAPQMPAEPRGRWRPMSLAPSTTAAEPSLRRAATPTLSSYNAAVWSALARHKPRASQRGSATVSFGISGSGGLAFVRVSRSSGNARLDQLALATVRGAAPFPSPPASLQGRPFVLRIDFP